MHDEAFAFLAANDPKGAKTVLDVGGRDINGSPRSLFPGAAYTALDAIDGNGVDVVADVTTWEDKRKFDVVVCAEVIEHAKDWRAVVEACWNRVKVGGTLLLTCATDGRIPHSAIDGGVLRPDEHYANVPAASMHRLLSKLGADDAKVGDHRERGDLYVLAVKKRAKRG